MLDQDLRNKGRCVVMIQKMIDDLSQWGGKAGMTSQLSETLKRKVTRPTYSFCFMECIS